MSNATTLDETHTIALTRIAKQSDSPDVLTSIYEESCNMAIWKRQLSAHFLRAIGSDIHTKPLLSHSIVVNAQQLEKDIAHIAVDREYGDTLREHIKQTIDMFCCLFETDKVGLRLSTLNKAMCPRFHVDKVPCRLITTFLGTGTQWLQHVKVDRTKLGHGNGGKPDDKSGLFAHSEDVQTLDCGDVALLKGETWLKNEGGGLVHRSPAVKSGESRLMMTLDFMGD